MNKITQIDLRSDLAGKLQCAVDQVESMSYFRRRCFFRRQYKSDWRHLFKYRAVLADDVKSIDRIKDILIRSQLWLSSPADFNDPFDTSATIFFEGTLADKRKRFDTLIKRQEPNMNWKRRQAFVTKIMGDHGRTFGETLQEIQNDLTKEFGVCSFAGDAKSILMWSHYANNHSGICIQFDRAHDPKAFMRAVPVEYTTVYPVINWTLDSTVESRAAVLRKHKGWEYEKESRIVVPLAAKSILPIHPAAVNAIIFGCNTSPDAIATVKSILAERSQMGMPRIKLYRAKRHAEKYALCLVRD